MPSRPTILPALKEALGVGGGFDDDRSDFDILFHIIDVANTTVFQGNTPFTLFAPNDASFIQTARDLELVGEDEDVDEQAGRGRT